MLSPSVCCTDEGDEGSEDEGVRDVTVFDVNSNKSYRRLGFFVIFLRMHGMLDWNKLPAVICFEISSAHCLRFSFHTDKRIKVSRKICECSHL